MLSNREKEVLSLHSVGCSTDEIGTFLYISRETVRKTISNIKIKLNLQKATELTAYYWCELFGTSLEEQKRNILSVGACMLVLFILSVENYDKRRYRFARKDNIETIEVYSTI